MRLTHLLLTSVFPPRTGGSGRWFWEIYRRLPREQFAVTAGAVAGDEEFDARHDLRLVRRPMTLPDWGIGSWSGLQRYGQLLWQVQRDLRRWGARMIHCGALLPDGWIGWLAYRVLRVPYLVYMHGEELCYTSSSRQLTWMGERILGSAATIIANSENTARILRERWHIAPERIQVLHPGVDTERFTPGPRDPNVRQRLGWNKRTVVLTVGRLQARKGQDMLLRALPAIRQAVPDVLYAIVGDGVERPRLEALVTELGLQGHVQFHGDVRDDQLPDLYRQCDLFALPNRQIGDDLEGFGMVLVEAQACGRPVLAGKSGGTAETLDPGRTGWLVDCTEPGTLAEAIQVGLREAAVGDAWGRQAREWVVRNYDWNSLAQQAARIFSALPNP